MTEYRLSYTANEINQKLGEIDNLAKKSEIPEVPVLSVNNKTGEINLSASDIGAASKSEGVFYIEGTGSTAGTWLGAHADITEYYPGLTIVYKVPVAGASTTKLNINSLGAVNVVRNATTGISTTCPVNSIIFLTYTMDGTTAYWKRADYDSDTKTRSSNKSDAKMFIIGATSQSTKGQTTYSNKNCYIGTNNRLYSNGAVVPNVDEINALIDAKLATIAAAEEVAF